MGHIRSLSTLSVLLVATFCRADWTVTNVHDDSVSTLNTFIEDITAVDAVGSGGPHPSVGIRWAGAAAAVSPVGSIYSALTCTDGGSWGGWANFGGPVFGGPHQAMLFYGNGATINLHASRIGDESEVADLWGNTQVGWGLKQGNTSAVLWQGNARSSRSLHPRGYIASRANSIFSDKIGGEVQLTQGNPLAAAWEGPKRRFRLLSNSTSAVLACSNSFYVGHVGFYNSTNSQAAMWPVSGGEIIIHPAGALNSQAHAIDQDKIALTARFGSRVHAMVYDTFNSISPYVDLNQVLDAQFPFEYGNAYAYAVYRDTLSDRILVGGAAWSLARGRNEAMVWEFNP